MEDDLKRKWKMTYKKWEKNERQPKKKWKMTSIKILKNQP